MDPFLIAFAVLAALLVYALRMAGSESRRRKKAWAAYYEYNSIDRTPRRRR